MKNLKDWMDHHTDVSACEPRQIDEGGKIAPTGSLLNTWWIDMLELTKLSFLFGSVGRIGKLGQIVEAKEFRQKHQDRKGNWQTEVVSGAALFARTDMVKKIGGFNEKLKLYYTDTDLCRKILQKGGKIWHIGEYFLGHSLSAATSQLSWKERSRIYANDARMYYRLTEQPVGAFLLYIAMRISALL